MTQLFLTIYSLPIVIYRLSKQHAHIQPRTCAEAHIRLLDVARTHNGTRVQQIDAMFNYTKM